MFLHGGVVKIIPAGYGLLSKVGKVVWMFPEVLIKRKDICLLCLLMVIIHKDLNHNVNGFGDGFFGGAVGTDMTDLCFQ